MTEGKRNIPGTVSIDGNVYAVNLLWGDSFSGNEASLELKKNMALVNTNLYAELVNNGEKQYALADKTLGHKRGMVSLASAIGFDGQSYCLSLPADDKIWVVLGVNKSGLVLFDKAFQSREEARNYFVNFVAYHSDWDHIYSEADSGSGENVELGSLINQKGIKIKETGLSSFIPVLVTGLCVAVIFFLLYTTISWWLEQNESEINLSEEPVLEKKLESLDTPWSGASKPLPLMLSCINAITEKRGAAASVPGWLPESVTTCDNDNVIYTVKRKEGLSLWLSFANEFFSADELPDIRNISKDEAVFSWRLNVEKYPVEKMKEGLLLNINDIRKYLSDSFEESFIPVDIGSPVVTDSRSDVYSINFKIKLSNNPLLIIPILRQINGLVISKIGYNYSSGEWNIEAKFWGSM
ncbi:Uncharacterised protein [Escherichia coli]|uniref:type 4b pilus protein PilO2 n=1 Tax=Escherichia coli TaxID=562 RepID=UPI001918F94B|nr:type 4b pilus protein PilO2 [Escherichia coli]CAD6176240.1 Uncharacterised protein [Escherichia coli]